MCYHVILHINTYCDYVSTDTVMIIYEWLRQLTHPILIHTTTSTSPCDIMLICSCNQRVFFPSQESEKKTQIFSTCKLWSYINLSWWLRHLWPRKMLQVVQCHLVANWTGLNISMWLTTDAMRIRSYKIVLLLLCITVRIISYIALLCYVLLSVRETWKPGVMRLESTSWPPSWDRSFNGLRENGESPLGQRNLGCLVYINI